MKPDGQNHQNSVISKWFLPELSFSDRWSRGTKTLGTRLVDRMFDFQSVLRNQHPNVHKHHNGSLDGMRIWVFVTNHIPYLLGLSNSFSNSFIDFSCEVVSSSNMGKNKA